MGDSRGAITARPDTGAIIARIAAAGLRQRAAAPGNGNGAGAGDGMADSRQPAAEDAHAANVADGASDVVNASTSSGAGGFSEELDAEAEAVGTVDRPGRNVEIDVNRGHEYDSAVSTDDWGTMRDILSNGTEGDIWRGQPYSDCCAAFIRRFHLEAVPASLLRRAQRRVDRRTPMSAVLGAYAEYSYLAAAIEYGRSMERTSE